MLKRTVLFLFMAVATTATGAVAQTKSFDTDYLRSTMTVLASLKYDTIDAAGFGSAPVAVLAKVQVEQVEDLGRFFPRINTPSEQLTNTAPDQVEDLSRFFNNGSVAQNDPAIVQNADQLEFAVAAAIGARQNSYALSGPVAQAILSVLNTPTKVIYLVPAFDEYIVRRGDTLFQIALVSYQNPELITRILLANLDAINNPNVIFEGQVIRLPRQ